MKIAIFISGSGSNLQALLDARAAGALDIEFALVLADRADAYGIQRALQRLGKRLRLEPQRRNQVEAATNGHLQLRRPTRT